MTQLKSIDVVQDETTTLALIDKYPEKFEQVVQSCYKTYSKPALAITDHFSRKWLSRAEFSEYRDEIEAVAAKLGKAGGHTLNLSYEWGCTTGAHSEADGTISLYRALDWPIKGMADTITVMKRAGDKGHYWDMTYLGMIGVLNAMAPQRFSIAINQAPLPINTRLPILQDITKPTDFIAARIATGKNKFIPAPFLLRKVFEQCATYEQAVKMLQSTEIATPAIFVVSGTKADEKCVIERLPSLAVTHKDKTCSANHWQSHEMGAAHARTIRSRDRLRAMSSGIENYKGDFDWLSEPVLNAHTRLAFEANAAHSTLSLLATEGSKIVTQKRVLQLS